MKSSSKHWWSGTKAHEKNALIVLGLFMAGIFLFVAGIVVGQAIALAGS